VLFSADAAALASNPVFRLKMVLLLAGLANAILFRLLWQRRLAGWSRSAPVSAKLQAGLSGTGWRSRAVAG
jgi:hypothetical protein